jgi:ArsR family transcriptional regulator
MNTLNNDKFIAKAAKALGDRYRLRIFQEICRLGSINCTQAQQLTNLAQPSISHHVRTLVSAELVDTDKRGREVNLMVNHEKMKEFFSGINQIASEPEGSQMHTNEVQPSAPSDLARGEEGKGSATSQSGAPKVADARHLPFD